MSTLRAAARELLRAYNEWVDTPAVFPSGDMLEAIDALQGALAEPSTDELLRRLRLNQLVMVRRDHDRYRAVARHQLERDGLPIVSGSPSDPVAALRAVLLRLPAPTEPPEEAP